MDEDNTVAAVAYPKNISNCEVVPFMPSGPSITNNEANIQTIPGTFYFSSCASVTININGSKC